MLRRIVGPAIALTGIGCGIFAVVHFETGGVARSIIAPVEFASFLLFGTTALWMRGRSLALGTLHAITLGWAAVILVNNQVFLTLHPETPHTFVLYLLVVAVGLVNTLPRWMYVSIVTAAIGVFVNTIGFSDRSVDSRVEATLALVAVVGFSAVVRHWVRENSRQMTELLGEKQRTVVDRDAALMHYRQITEMATDLIAEIDEEGTLLYTNPAHERVFGYAPGSLVGRKFSEFMGPEAKGRDREMLEGMLDAPTGPQRVGVVHASGERRVIEVSSRPYRATDGSRRLVMTSHDVTEQVSLEAERARHRAELEVLVEERTEALRLSMAELQRRERLAAVGTLAAGVAHQINNPVGSVRMSAEYALRTASGSSDEVAVLREALAANVREAKRCGEIVKNLLRFARDDRGQIERVDLTQLTERVVDLCQSYAASRRSVIERELEAGSLAVDGNAVELEQLLVNLVRNAVESRKSRVRVQVTLERRGGEALIEVADDGEGMSEEDRNKIFDPFFTTRLNDGGTGLGLSVAHGIASAHRGVLTVQSQPGKGTRMRLSLPVVTTRPYAAGASAPPV